MLDAHLMSEQEKAHSSAQGCPGNSGKRGTWRGNASVSVTCLAPSGMGTTKL